jgi:hypothetical protein
VGQSESGRTRTLEDPHRSSIDVRPNGYFSLFVVSKFAAFMVDDADLEERRDLAHTSLTNLEEKTT